LSIPTGYDILLLGAYLMSLNDDEKKILKEKIRGQRREMWDGERPVRRPRSDRSPSLQTTQKSMAEKQANSGAKVQGTDWNEDIILPSQSSESIEMPVSSELTWKSYLAIALSAITIIGLGFCLGYIFAS